tara:strand:+ start:756 stop:992 length:237 start_codon:yes stop_codon:yes gene_type:complete
MSKINNYVIWCEEEGYTNEEGEVVSMEYANEYMQSLEYDKEHRKQAFKQALSEADENSLFGMMHKLGYLVQRHKDLKS